MKIIKGQKLVVIHQRKGRFIGEATDDFETCKDKEVFYPIKLVEGEPIKLSGRYKIGDKILCSNSFTTIKII